MNIQIRVTGAVQGVGYRPFAARLAEELNIRGEVRNSAGIVEISAQGREEDLGLYVRALKEKAPHGAAVMDVRVRPDREREFGRFVIADSTDRSTGSSDALPIFPPDIGICPDCAREMKDPSDRRYRYSLISCVSCGPRYTILDAFPYDRERTSMKAYPMCPACGGEYRGRGMRRRHAQTVSCHDCGPQYVLSEGEEFMRKETAVREAVRILRSGGILALKGTGGFQLLCDAGCEEAVRRLREMKGREKKPFAVMFSDAGQASMSAWMDEEERALLESDARPIVLILRKPADATAGSTANGADPAGLPVPFIAPSVCGDSRFIGAFLPSIGMHLILTEAAGPLVVTSANLSGLPIPVRDEDMLGPGALVKADAVLWHDREILRPMDDSVVFRQDGRTAFIRRSRGYVPLPVLSSPAAEDKDAGEETPRDDACARRGEFWSDILAYGADLKASFALSRGDRILLSQYYGDLEELAVLKNYRSGIADLCALYKAEPRVIAADLHPRYFSAEEAKKRGTWVTGIQHHHAHCASVMAERGLRRCVGIALDGTGCGLDGSLWGGEIFLLDGSRAVRTGRLKPVLLLGGDAASLDADLAADSYLYAAGEECRNPLARAALENRIGTVESSSTGRLFDAVSSILGIGTVNRYEGECAVLLENAAEEALERRERGGGMDMDPESGEADLPEASSFVLRRFVRGMAVTEIDQTAIAEAILGAKRRGKDPAALALWFHRTLAEALAAAAAASAAAGGVKEAVLSGGVFANRLMRRFLERLLRKAGLAVYFNEQVPMNDGGIAAGQAYLARLALLEGAEPDRVRIIEEDLCV